MERLGVDTEKDTKWLAELVGRTTRARVEKTAPQRGEEDEARATTVLGPAVAEGASLLKLPVYGDYYVLDAGEKVFLTRDGIVLQGGPSDRFDAAVFLTALIPPLVLGFFGGLGPVGFGLSIAVMLVGGMLSVANDGWRALRYAAFGALGALGIAGGIWHSHGLIPDSQAAMLSGMVGVILGPLLFNRPGWRYNFRAATGARVSNMLRVLLARAELDISAERG